jgi:hypothetical protein
VRTLFFGRKGAPAKWLNPDHAKEASGNGGYVGSHGLVEIDVFLGLARKDAYERGNRRHG